MPVFILNPSLSRYRRRCPSEARVALVNRLPGVLESPRLHLAGVGLLF